MLQKLSISLYLGVGGWPLHAVMVITNYKLSNHSKDNAAEVGARTDPEKLKTNFTLG